MKKINFYLSAICLLLIVSHLSLPIQVNAQIDLEHTFDDNLTGNISINFTPVNPVIDYYTYFDKPTNEVRFYNEDYSLYKSVFITPPADYTLSHVSNFSKNIFTTDNKIVFCVHFNNLNVGNNSFIMKFYDEDGLIIQDFGISNNMMAPIIHRVSNNSYRLHINRMTYCDHPVNGFKYQTEIYVLIDDGTEIEVKRIILTE